MEGEPGVEITVVLVVVVFLIVLLVLRRLVQGNTNARGARQILDKRYARGDIDREEYVWKRRDLKSRRLGAR